MHVTWIRPPNREKEKLQSLVYIGFADELSWLSLIQQGLCTTTKDVSKLPEITSTRQFTEGLGTSRERE